MLARTSAPRFRAWRLGASALAAFLLASCGGGSDSTGTTSGLGSALGKGSNSPFEIRTVNNRADLVSTGDAAIETKVRAARPANTQDFCILSGDLTQSIKVFDPAACDADPFLKPSLSPRQVAGGPRAEDVLKCQLKPLNRNDYAGITDAQFGRLQAVFATGVCDWSKPGAGQQVAISPLTFKAGPGGQPLPPAPVSTRK